MSCCRRARNWARPRPATAAAATQPQADRRDDRPPAPTASGWRGKGIRGERWRSALLGAGRLGRRVGKVALRPRAGHTSAPASSLGSGGHPTAWQTGAMSLRLDDRTMNRPVLLSVQCVAAQAQLRKHAALLSPQLHRQHRGGFLHVHRQRLCSAGWSWS